MTDTKTACEAIMARRNGEFDHPALVQIGPLSSDETADIRHIKTECLRSYGFIVGDRNHSINTDYLGAFMVCEGHEPHELPTKDGSNGPWCIVGDDLNELIDKGFMFLVGSQIDEDET